MKDELNKKNNQQENVPSKKKKRSKNDIIIKVLTVACVICAIALISVIVIAFIGGNDSVTPGNATAGNVTPDGAITTTAAINPSNTTFPGINNGNPSTQPSALSTTAPTTAASTQKLVYATEEVNVRSGPSTDDEILTVLSAGESAIYISIDEEGWCKVMYDGEICYVHRDYLTTVNPAGADAATTQPAATTTRKTVDPNAKLWYLVVVDKTRQLPEGFEPELEYVDSSDTEQLDARVVPYYDAMVEAALEDGVEIEANSGFRSYETQESNFNDLVEEYMYEYDVDEQEAIAMVEKEILPPGCSEHNYGLAMDIGYIDESFGDTEAYEWLDANAHKYGFIERYTEEKQSITNIIPEPWHWRFVGPEHATKMKNAGVTLEEYLQYYKVAY